ncbi:FadR/GntR family transcriptional regulator [Deinococcus antarcticus]|uniref:FadR/GntR family transcriptional regulator n=1 Tax=Deinococcus antarcticus TaxID=1298767 RepID=A0ABV8AB97_9DEIO
MPVRVTPAIRPLPRRSSVGADIARQLQQLINEGTLKTGDRLPSQRELAQQFGASLAGVREALSVLSAAGLIEARPGRGTVVSSVGGAVPSFDGWLGVISDAEEFEELVQARRLLETFTIAQAVQLATPAQVASLRAAVETMREKLNDPEAYTEADMKFHLLLAEVAGNRVVTRLMRAIQRPLMQQLRYSIIHLQKNGRLADNLATHVRIVDGIERHERELAQQGFDEMLTGALVKAPR